jgi:N-acetylglutamate synthase-like GNAT family acetyltransferase
MGYCWRGRPATSEDGPAIIELFNEVFHANRSISHWKWKFLDNPSGKVCIFVAQDGNRIVGQYAILPTWMNLHGEKVMGGQSLDIMTHPDYRKQGIFVSLAKQCFDQAASQDISVLYVFPNEQSYPGFVNRLGWYDIGNLPKLIRILNRKVIIERTTNSAAIAGLFEKPVELLLKVLKGCVRPRPSAHVEIRKIDTFDDRLDSLWKRINDKASLGVWKDSSYLNWRYLLCPEKQYTMLVAEENSTLVGVAVLECGVAPSRF